MSFATELYTLMTANTALNAGVSGIYHQNLPDNFDMKAKFIVYNFSLTDSIDHLQRNNEIDIYNLELIIIAPDTAGVDAIVTLVRAYLDNYMSTKFRDIHCDKIDNHSEGDREQSISIIQYKIHYQN